MANRLIKSATAADYENITGFIHAQNRHDNYRCLHSDETDPAGLLARIQKLATQDEICVALDIQNGDIIGLLGCEYDRGLRRGWLWGPFGVPDRAIDAALLIQLKNSLPAEVRRLDSFLDQRNQRGQTFYTTQGFYRAQDCHVYVAQKPALTITPTLTFVAPQEHHLASLSDLHERLFPQSYETARSMFDKMDDERRLFTHIAQDRVAGYIFARINDGDEEGFIDFLGVHESQRGKGIGKQLLLTALHWLFEDKRMPQVGLTVTDKNTNARALYEQTGFHLHYAGVNHRLEF